MALVKCKECGEKVSTEAKACPKCGAKPPKKTSFVFWGIVIIVLLAVFVMPEDHNSPPRLVNKKQSVTESAGVTDTKEKESVKSRSYASDDAFNLCNALESTGLVTKCKVSGWSSTIDVVIDANSSEARKMCSGIVTQMKQYTQNFKGQWKLKIFSPYSGKNAIAVCTL